MSSNQEYSACVVERGKPPLFWCESITYYYKLWHKFGTVKTKIKRSADLA